MPFAGPACDLSFVGAHSPLKRWARRSKLTIGNAFRRRSTPHFPPMSISHSKSLFSELSAAPPIAADGSAALSAGTALPHRPGDAWHRRLGTWLASNLGERGDTTWQGLLPSTRRRTALLDARTAFRAAINDIPRSAGAAAALERIRAARSLDELWELRNELFSLISCHHDQGEATRRIDALDPHFGRQLRRTASTRKAQRRGR
jgi:hypothetical protein